MGIQGQPLVDQDKVWGMPPGPKGCRSGDLGVVPEPANLFEAQRTTSLETR